MINHVGQLIPMFCNIHALNVDKHDVRLMENSDYEVTGVGFYKDNTFCWGSTLAEITFDALAALLEGET